MHLREDWRGCRSYAGQALGQVLEKQTNLNPIMAGDPDELTALSGLPPCSQGSTN